MVYTRQFGCRELSGILRHAGAVVEIYAKRHVLDALVSDIGNKIISQIQRVRAVTQHNDITGRQYDGDLE